uniref:Formin like 1 n=1 Tax=Oreochromis niloticus TaxID=8128 RepID=A0A669DTT6_ORENI
MHINVHKYSFLCNGVNPSSFEFPVCYFHFINTMNLPPDKVKILSQYDSEKKWDLILFFDLMLTLYTLYQFRRRVQESTQILRELEISLRTNHIGWAQEFLNEENQGLDVLVDYLSVAHSAVTYEVETVDNGTLPTDKGKTTDKPGEDLKRSASNSPTHSALKGGKAFTVRKALRNSRVVSQKDDVHLCIMCLRAIMNYQSGFNQVMKHPSCVNEITLSLNDRNPRTKALVLELLAAVCLVRGGHDIILAAFDNFKEVCGEKNRFEKLIEYFHNEESNIDFMVACMQFINIVVHSVENMNFRVHLQYEFTQHGLDDYLEKLKFTESDRLLVQIQAYLDNIFDVGALLEDAETKNALLEHMEELQEHNAQVDTGNNLQAVPTTEAPPQSESVQAPPPPPPLPAPSSTTAPPPPPPPPAALLPSGGGRTQASADATKKAIQTKYRMPLFNWQALKSNQVAGTIFSELDDERILEELNMAAFEEQFKTKAQSTPVDLGTLKKKMAHKSPSKVSLMEPNRAKNLAITLRKEGMAASDICCVIETYNLKALSLDFLELLERFIPTEYEMKLIHNYECEGRPLDELSEEDRFMVRFSKIPRLSQRISALTFMGNFPESVQLIQPQLNAIIAASMSIKSSTKLKKILEIILAFGNYMNSSKRGAAYGFRLQSLDLLLDTKSTDRKQTLMHFIVNIIQEKYPELQSFHTELHFLDKASLGNILQDLRALERGMEGTKREFSIEKDNPVLQSFLNSNVELLNCLIADGKTAQDAYDSAVEYFGENPKTTPPSMFFPILIRFIKAYKGPMMPRAPQMDLIAELKKRQMSPLVREGKDGAIEDIITALKSVPFTARSAKRSSRLFCDSVFSEEVMSSNLLLLIMTLSLYL